MNRQNFIDRFYFKDDRVFDDDIGAIATRKTNAFVNQMQFDLPLKSHARARQFEPKTILISMFKKPRTDGTMDFDCHADHPSGYLLPIHLPPTLFVTLACFKIFVIHGTPPPHDHPDHSPKPSTNP